MRWCLTPASNADKHIAGPFATRDEAERRAVELLPAESKWDALLNARMPNFLVPTPCTRSHATLVVKQEPVAAVAAKMHKLKAAAPLPPTIYKLNELQLRYFCTQLGIKLPSQLLSRADIISIIAKELTF